MNRYFKLVALYEPNPSWVFEEYQNGRARFGWSPPGSDLRELQGKSGAAWTNQDRTTWSYTRFLLHRIQPGDRLVIQTERPLRRFLIAEVVQPGYDSSGSEHEDFNHFLHIRPLTPEYLDVNARYVSASLKHDLTKRGNYYQIYSATSTAELNRIVEQRLWTNPEMAEPRTDQNTLDATHEAIKRSAIQEISRQYPAKEFEKFCRDLCHAIDYVEVNELADRHKGWDMLIQIRNPVTGDILLDDVPVQCKNFRGHVFDQRGVNDLVRCFENKPDATLAYLFIMGTLTSEFRMQRTQAEVALREKLGRDVRLEVVDQDRIAELYLEFLFPEFRPVQKGAE